MKICANCGQSNREGTVFCEVCGLDLGGRERSVVALTKLLSQTLSQADSAASEIKAKWGTAGLDPDSPILIRIQEVPDAIVLHLEDKVVLGRISANFAGPLVLDLSPYQALEKGVSRSHAIIVRNKHAHVHVLTLTDLDSANNTYLNGQQLAPHKPRVLRDGDEIRLGHLVMHIYFK